MSAALQLVHSSSDPEGARLAALDRYDILDTPKEPAFERVLPSRPELSYLLTHVPDPSRESLLTDDEKVLIATWIEEGAPDN